jgi:hypothetical protein
MGQLKGPVDTQENGLWTNKYIDTSKTAPGSN